MNSTAEARTPLAATGSPLRVPTDFSSELRLLLTLLRCALHTGDPAEVGELCRGMDWTRFAACFKRHRVGAFLHHRLPPRAREALPEPTRSELGRAAGRAMRRSLTRATELARIVRVLEDGGIGVASLKGPLLSLELYGDLGHRHSGDLDLIVGPSEVLRTDAILRACGYVRVEPDFELTPRQQEAHLRFHRENKYLGPANGIRLEVKWRLFGSAGDWRGERKRKEVAGRGVETLSIEENALYLFVHGARHGWFRVFWLVDVALLLLDRRIDWPTVRSDARKLGAERSLLQGAALACELLGVPLPGALVPLPGEQRVLGWLVAHAKRQVSRRVRPGSEPPEPVGYAILLESGWRARREILQGRFMYARNWRILPLPDSLFGLHYAAAPALWLYRRIAGRSGHHG